MQQGSTQATQPFAPERSALISEIVTRAVIALTLALFLWRASMVYGESENPGLIILVLSELFTIGLVLFSRMPKYANRSIYAWVLVFVSILYAVLLQLSESESRVLISPAITQSLQLVGFIFQVSTKVWLGRCFGLLPETRGIVTTGPYRLVRHPIYFGYLLNHVGFLLSHFNLWNLGVLTILYVCQVLRMKEEEKVLQFDPQYEQYMKRTIYRLVPYLY